MQDCENTVHTEYRTVSTGWWRPARGYLGGDAKIGREPCIDGVHSHQGAMSRRVQWVVSGRSPVSLMRTAPSRQRKISHPKVRRRRQRLEVNPQRASGNGDLFYVSIRRGE